MNLNVVVGDRVEHTGPSSGVILLGEDVVDVIPVSTTPCREPTDLSSSVALGLTEFLVSVIGVEIIVKVVVGLFGKTEVDENAVPGVLESHQLCFCLFSRFDGPTWDRLF
jgi:hypothetical protein